LKIVYNIDGGKMRKKKMIPCKHKGNPKYAKICLGDFEETFVSNGSGAKNIRCPPCRAARVQEEHDKNKRYYAKNVKTTKASLLTNNKQSTNKEKPTNDVISSFLIEIRVSKN